jgi:hypothetical protein
MFKVLFKSIDSNATPLPFGGTASLIPERLARGGGRSVDITISIDTNLPYARGRTTWDGDNLALVADWLPDQYGKRGKPVGDEPSPIDLIHALTLATWLEWEIVEGKEILDLPVPELPLGAIA